MKDKHISILTRQLSMQTLGDNDVYKSQMALKVFYPTRCELSPEQMVEVDHKYRVTVKEHKLNVDPFLQIVEDMKTLKRDDGSPNLGNRG